MQMGTDSRSKDYDIVGDTEQVASASEEEAAALLGAGQLPPLSPV